MATELQTKLIEFAKIDESPARDARAELRQALVDEYADALLADVDLGHGVLFWDGAKHWLGDGLHRGKAGRKRGHKGDVYEIRPGGYDEAFAFACRANDAHGGRTSNEDKRARCEAYWRRHWPAEGQPRPSDRAVALACNVSHELAGRVRKGLESDGALSTVDNARAADGRTYPSRRRKSEAEASVALDGETRVIDPPSANGRHATNGHAPAVEPELAWKPLDGEDEPISGDEWDAAEAEQATREAAERVRKLIAKAAREVDGYAERASLKGSDWHDGVLESLDEALRRFNAAPEGAAT